MGSEQISWDQILGVSSIFIAVMALLFTLWQIAVSRKHNRLSVKPHLDIFYGSEADSAGACFKLQNNGTGPAFLKAYTIYINGEPNELKTIEDIVKIHKQLDPHTEFLELTYFNKGEGIKEGNFKYLMRIDKKHRNSEGIIPVFLEISMGIGFEIKYESIYGEEFTLPARPFVPPAK